MSISSLSCLLILIQSLQIYNKYNFSLINNEPFMLYGVCFLIKIKIKLYKVTCEIDYLSLYSIYMNDMRFNTWKARCCLHNFLLDFIIMKINLQHYILLK
jgi:hypothetical protein